MTTFEQIQKRHAVLEQALVENSDSVRTGQITSLLAQIQETAVLTANETERQTLAHIFTFWANIAQQRGEPPVSNVLAAYQPPAPPPAPVAPPPPPEPATITVPAPPPAAKAAPRLPRINWSNPPEWMLQGLTLLIIAVLALAGYYILAYYFDTETEEPVAEVEPTVEPTVEIAIFAEETAVVPPPATPAALLVEVVPADAAPNTAANAPQRTHIVGPGDTLSTLATRYGVSIEAITAANTLVNPNQLEIGQTLTIPFPSQAGTPAAPSGTVVPTQPAPAAPTAIAEVVVRGADITAVIPLYLSPSTASQAIATLSSGTFAKALGQSEDRSWYLIELADGATRGWVTVDSAALLYPATPDQLPLLRVVNP